MLAWYDRRSHDDLTRLDQQLTTLPWLAVATPTIADIACGGYLYFIHEPWAEQAGIDLTLWPNVRDWLARIAQLPGFRTPEAMFSGHDARY